MNKKEYYMNESVKRLNSSIYKTTVKGVEYIIKDLDMDDRSLFYSAIRELSVLLITDHPNIIKVIDYFIDDNVLYIVLPYIACSLYDLMKKHRKANTFFPPDQMAKIIKGSLAAMYYLHENGITHRDLKPENIMVDEAFNPILIDFGQTKKLLFKNSTQISTCYYRAPEVLGWYEKKYTEHYNQKIDVWGIGTIVFEMVTNQQLAVLPDEDYDNSEHSDTASESASSERSDSRASSCSLFSESSYETTDDSDNYSDGDEHSGDNLFIIHDLFRKLGIPSDHVLDTYNLRKFIPVEENLPPSPEAFLTQLVKNPDAYQFLCHTLDYDPVKRYTIKQCIESSFVRQPVPSIKLIKLKPKIDLHKTTFNMGYFQKKFSEIQKELKAQGIKEEALQKAKKLVLYFAGAYEKTIPKDWITRLIGVCIYICDNLVSDGDHGVDFYTHYIECSENRFSLILKEVLEKSLKVLFIL